LNSPGLGAALRRLSNDEDIMSSPKYSMYLMMLFVEMRLGGYIEQMEKTLRHHPGHRVVRDLARMAALRTCLEPKTPDSDANRLMSMLAELTGTERPGRDAVVRRSSERSRIIEALKRARARHRSDPPGSYLVEDMLGVEEEPDQ